MNDESPEQLAELATDYLLDGLTPAQCAAFERRLAEDQPAREALADAVELLAAIVAVEEPPVGPLSRPRRRRRRAIEVAACAAAVAACLLLALSWRAMNPNVPDDRPDDGSVATPEAENAEAELAVAWSQARGKWAAEQGADPTDDPADPTEADLVADRPAELEPPSWMLAALVEMRRDELPETPEGFDR